MNTSIWETVEQRDTDYQEYYNRHFYLIKGLAGRYANHGLEYDDLHQLAATELLKLMERYYHLDKESFAKLFKKNLNLVFITEHEKRKTKKRTLDPETYYRHISSLYEDFEDDITKKLFLDNLLIQIRALVSDLTYTYIVEGLFPSLKYDAFIEDCESRRLEINEIFKKAIPQRIPSYDKVFQKIYNISKSKLLQVQNEAFGILYNFKDTN